MPPTSNSVGVSPQLRAECVVVSQPAKDKQYPLKYETRQRWMGLSMRIRDISIERRQKPGEWEVNNAVWSRSYCDREI